MKNTSMEGTPPQLSSGHLPHHRTDIKTPMRASKRNPLMREQNRKIPSVSFDRINVVRLIV